MVLSLHTLYGINDWLVGAGLGSHTLVCFAIADVEPSTLFVFVLHLMHFRMTFFLPLTYSATNFEDQVTCPVFSLRYSVVINGASSTSPHAHRLTYFQNLQKETHIAHTDIFENYLNINKIYIHHPIIF